MLDPSNWRSLGTHVTGDRCELVYSVCLVYLVRLVYLVDEVYLVYLVCPMGLVRAIS